MEKKSGSKIMRRLIHRDSLPSLSFGHNASKDKARRKSEGMVTVPEHLINQTTTPTWYLKEIQTRDAAEELLNKAKIGTFLVRDSETAKSPGCYTLSLLYKDKCRHHKIETNPNNSKLVIKGYGNHQFDDLDRLVEFFIQSQKKDIHLIPYDPHSKDQEDCVESCIPTQLHQPYEEMQGSECQDDLYQTMNNSVERSNHRTSQGPPPLPTRKETPQLQQSYENLNPIAGRSVPQPPGTQSYENIPSKGPTPMPLPQRPNDAPPLPPRTSNAGANSYENTPGRPPPLPGSKGHFGGQPSGYENSTRPQSTHGHGYQNLPPKVTPRRSGKKVAYSAEQELPPRHKATAPFRRSQTDTESDWQRRGYNQ